MLNNYLHKKVQIIFPLKSNYTLYWSTVNVRVLFYILNVNVYSTIVFIGKTIYPITYLSDKRIIQIFCFAIVELSHLV